MLDGREAFGRPAADALRRRIRRDQLGMLRLERLELVHQRVELGVDDLRRGVDVIELFVAANLAAELLDSFGGRHQTSRSLRGTELEHAPDETFRTWLTRAPGGGFGAAVQRSRSST